VFYSPVKKNYSFSIKMSTRIKRLPFAIWYKDLDSDFEGFRKKFSVPRKICPLG